jgi:tRNA acetyltransferase TAN1
VPTDLEQIKQVTHELAAGMGENETFRITVEKRFTDIHSKDIIDATASEFTQKADLENPDRILLIEVLGAFTGVSLVKPADILAVVKEKML